MRRGLDGKRFAEGREPGRTAIRRPFRAESRAAEKERLERDPSAREALCDAAFGRRERAGRGVARWGRYRLAADSVEALRMIGIFRGADCDDLTEIFDSRARGRQVLNELEDSGLIAIERFQRGRVKLRAASLTRQGKRLLTQAIDPRETGDESAQAYRSGPAQDSQVLHDAAVFRAAQREMQALAARGCTVVRVRTEADLLRLATRSIDRAKRSGRDPHTARSAVAARLGLAEHDGQLTFPDVRLEYREAQRDELPRTESVDVEVTTPDYRDAALRAKAAAGFRVYRMLPDGSLASDVPSPDAGCRG